MSLLASGFVQAVLLLLAASAILLAWTNSRALRGLRAELAAERGRSALMVRATRSGIVDLDVPAEKVGYSERFAEMLGFPPQADISDRTTFFDRVHPEDREQVRATFLEHVRDGGGEAQETIYPAIEYRLRRVDGSYAWVRGTGLSLRDRSGRALRYVASVIDISLGKQQEIERSNQQAELRTQQQRLALVVRGAQVGIVDWDAASGTTWHSERYKELLGYPPDADTSQWPEVFDMMHPEDRARVYEAHVGHLRTGGGAGGELLHEPIEYRLRRADGSWVWVQGMGLSVRGADGRATRFLAAVADIGARRAQEEALRDQIKLTRDIIDANPNPLFLKDAALRHVQVNAAWEKLTGIAAERAIGRTTEELMPPELAREYTAQDEALIASGAGTSSIEVTRPRRRGPRTYILNKSVLLRADASVRGLVGTITDVTRMKNIETELRASREEALQAAQAKAAFLATMSHEIRTPLNGVLGMAGLLADTRLTPEQREYVDTILVSGDALLTAINDILDFSKIESGRMDLEDEPLEPVRAIEESLEILGERARAKGLELIAEIDDGVPGWVLGDFARLRQVLVNLVGNAVKFTEQGEIVVSARAVGEDIELRVTDTGIGIAPERLGALFEAFTQADASTTRKYGGTGLGLAISRRLVQLMGGALRGESELGKGSCFSFSLRARPVQAVAPPRVSPAAAELAGKRILIVDDNATNLRILTRQLERWGALPVAAASGAAALERLAGDASFDAAVLDYHMPVMDGVMLARDITARRPGLPLLLLSSSMHRRAEEAEKGLFAVQMLKPVRQQQLKEALAAAIAAPLEGGLRARGKAAKRELLGKRLPLRILVVDDFEVNRRLAVLLLRNLGYKADTAGTGREALEAVARKRYDLVLMDVQMPDLDGLQATREIVRRHGNARLRIVAMTASAMAGDREKCLAAGMDDYLAKPLDPLRLREALERRGELAAAGEVAAGAWPAIDWQRLESLKVFDDGDMLKSVIAAFLAEAPVQLAAIRAAQSDAARLGAAAHALTGAAANIGAKAVQQLSARIERLARVGDLAGAAPCIGELAPALETALLALGKRGA